MTVEYIFNPSGPNEYTLTDSDISASAGHNPIRTHTGKSDCDVTFAYDRTLEQFAQRQDRVNVSIDGDVKFCGYVIDCRHTEGVGQAPTTRLRIDGIEKRLEETRPDDTVTYNQISLADAIRDYWPRTPFNNVTVTDQTTELVADDETIQEADTTTEWENVTDIQATDPVAAQNGAFELLQTSHHGDARNGSGTFGTISNSRGGSSDYVDGAAALLENNGDSTTITVNVPYTIPEDQVGFAVRQGADDSPAVEWRINGTTVDSVAQALGNLSFGWVDVGDGELSGGGGWTNGDLSGSVDLTVEVTAADSAEDIAIDWLVLYDQRFTYTFDNSTDANDELSGPELYPDSYTFTFDEILTSYNIESATITSTWNDTTGSQQLEVSNDGGNTFTSASNTDTLTANFANPGRAALVRVTLSRFGTQTETPTNGVNGQAIDVYDLSVDGNDLVVIDELELTRSHFQNLQTLHEFGDFLFVVEHGDESLANMPVSSFQRGDETRAKPSGFDDQSNKQPEVQAEAYYNTIYLEGALQDDGTRPTTEVSDSDAVAEDGRDISPGVLRDLTINTDAGAIFRARSLLETALQNRDLKGTVTVSPSLVDPGYARPVDFGDGETDKTVEEVSLRETGDSVEATYEFVVRPGFATEIDDLKRNANEIGNQV